jgi:carbon storage regulator
MLVITRKPDQSIVIDGRIEVRILSIGRDGVRLGIQAPREVQVHRREVFEAIAEANRAASSSGKVPLQDAAALLRARMGNVPTGASSARSGHESLSRPHLDPEAPPKPSAPGGGASPPRSPVTKTKGNKGR